MPRGRKRIRTMRNRLQRMLSGRGIRSDLPLGPREVLPKRVLPAKAPHQGSRQRTVRVSWLPTLDDRTRCSDQISDGLWENISRIASSKGYGILLDVPGVSVHVVRVVGIVDHESAARAGQCSNVVGSSPFLLGCRATGVPIWDWRPMRARPPDASMADMVRAT
jgi:hypothetical protein